MNCLLNQILKSGLFLTAFLLSQAPALAGGYSVGNGGVVWACVSGHEGSILNEAMLTDLYEARIQFKRTLIPDLGGDPMAIYNGRKIWMQQNLPSLYSILKDRFSYVEQHMSIVNAELVSTMDFILPLRPLPSTCPLGKWIPQNIANFREDDQLVLIQENLWNSPKITSLDKAALLFHEAIYYWMRSAYAETTSDKARKIVGILFSTLSPAEMKLEIEKILGQSTDIPDGNTLCVIKNLKRNQVYVTYGKNTDDASLKARLRCQEDPDSRFCSRDSIECEEIMEASPHRCVADNVMTNKIFIGIGRNELEAKYKAHLSCFIGSTGEKASPRFCTDFSFMECN